MYASGRVLTADGPDGFVRVVAVDGTLLGVQIVGEHASELLAQLGMAVQKELTLADVATTVNAHPTL